MCLINSIPANEEYDIKLNLWRKEIESRTNKIESRLKDGQKRLVKKDSMDIIAE